MVQDIVSLYMLKSTYQKIVQRISILTLTPAKKNHLRNKLHRRDRIILHVFNPISQIFGPCLTHCKCPINTFTILFKSGFKDSSKHLCFSKRV